MNYPTIKIVGEILSADILDKIEQGELGGQLPKDFGFGEHMKVKDAIQNTWAAAQQFWRAFKWKTESLPERATGASETRKLWIVPLLELLGYDPELSKSEVVNGKTYAISHRAANRDGFPIHIMGSRDSLDRKRKDGGPRMSPHALVQEYLNLTEHLYAVVTNGNQIRLLRDSSRLVKLSYIEFDMERMVEEEHFADFAIFYRLLHASRMPARQDAGAESLIEKYHQDALDAGSRIRAGLSAAVKSSIVAFALGFLNHPENSELRRLLAEGKLSDKQMYHDLLRLIYRLLFLLVIEARDLIFSKETPAEKRNIYYDFYSVGRLRDLSEKRYLADARYSDLWLALKQTFRLFESEHAGKPLAVKPLAGDLFGADAIGALNRCQLDNKVLLGCLKNLSIFTSKNTGQLMRVNYAALSVEEFGSVYEGLLEFEPVASRSNGQWRFDLRKGSERSASGSHYTPDELVQPLIKHSLDHIIDEKLKEADKEQALLAIKVCDVACGSGHILLNAARRIATELARARTGEDQPSPLAMRQALRDVVRRCIYGVDKNPLAVELCKVALWLEAHNPGEPLHFLDHHIKCGDAIVGLAHREELERGIADEAFKTLPGDDKEVATVLRKRNRQERLRWEEGQGATQLSADFGETRSEDLRQLADQARRLTELPETTPAQVTAKQAAYEKLQSKASRWRLWTLANLRTAQFFIPKTLASKDNLVTDAGYRETLAGHRSHQSRAAAFANSVASERRFFHWFLEFPEVFERGGFDCILGNPPFLGGQKLTGTFGYPYTEWLKSQFAPIGSCDLVTYFYRRIFTLIREGGFQSLIATNTIAQGNAREGGLAIILQQGGSINHAVRSMRWPGLAAVEVALVTIYNGDWGGRFVLDRKDVAQITSFLDDTEPLGEPHRLRANAEKSFQGSIVLGKGFILKPDEAQRLLARNPKNKDVLFPYLNGADLNSRPDQSPSRWVINFQDWEENFCRKNYPECFEIVERLVRLERSQKSYSKNAREKWWHYERLRPELYRTIAPLERVLVTARVSKYVSFVFVAGRIVFHDKIVVMPFAGAAFCSILQSSIHESWAWKYSSTLGSLTINYSPSDCFQTFPFPRLRQAPRTSEVRGALAGGGASGEAGATHLESASHLDAHLGDIGERYYRHRQQLMRNLQLGLTKTYNLFHHPELTVEVVEKASKQPRAVCEQAFADILKLRQLHQQMDEAVLAAYGWGDLHLGHGFHEVDYLPENDRVRFTISPTARKEVLKRLLLLNHERHAEEEGAS